MNELENLKVGDIVIVSGVFADKLSKVMRVTKAQILVDNRHYRKKDGCLVGGSEWEYGRIKPATDEDINRINERERKEELIAFIRRNAWSNLSLESLETICDVVKKEIGNSAAKQ